MWPPQIGRHVGGASSVGQLVYVLAIYIPFGGNTDGLWKAKTVYLRGRTTSRERTVKGEPKIAPIGVVSGNSIRPNASLLLSPSPSDQEDAPPV